MKSSPSAIKELPARQRLRVGAWTADPATNELRRGEESVRIEPKAMDVLVALAAQAGAVVTREALFEAVWPGTVVGDEALSQSVAKLRRALGDDPRSPTYIETISKRGYRLLAPVERLGARAPGRWPGWWPAAATALLIPLTGLVWYWADRGRAAGPAAGVEDRQGEWVSVAVMPFEAIGAEPYLAHGISDTLATELGRAPALRVIGTAAGDAGEGARRARYLVTGSVQREGDALRVNVRLTDTRTNEQLWAERFERAYGDLFAMQDEIIRRLATSLPAKLSDAERQRLAKRHTRSLEAFDAFLRAQALFLARGARENEEARALYRRAIEIDPRFARAYAGLAMTFAIEPRMRSGIDAAAALERARELAESARLIDPDVAEVHWALGFVHAQARRHDQALASLERAVQINPSFADAHALMGGIHTYVGAPEKTIPLVRTAMRLNPDGGYLYHLLLGRAYFFGKDAEQAQINLREAIARNPADLESHVYMAATAGARGDRAAADWEAQEIRTLDPGFSVAGWLASYPLASRPHRERLSRALTEAGLRP